jgi:hypothetical protein
VESYWINLKYGDTGEIEGRKRIKKWTETSRLING